MHGSNEIVTSLAALAHGYRLRIFRLLANRGVSGITARDIAEALEASPTNTSFHLKELSRAGLLRSTREGRYLHYAINPEEVRKLLDYLPRHCCRCDPKGLASSLGLRIRAKSNRR